MDRRKTPKQKLHDELNRIEVVHRHWNRLSMAERASIAKISPDLSAFFHREINQLMAGSRLGANKAQSTNPSSVNSIACNKVGN